MSLILFRHSTSESISSFSFALFRPHQVCRYMVYEVGPLPEDTRIRQIWEPRLGGEEFAFLRGSVWFDLAGWNFVVIMGGDREFDCISLCDISHENVFYASLGTSGRSPSRHDPHSVSSPLSIEILSLIPFLTSPCRRPS